MVTMADVARLAGVNASTVSHVLNGTRTVSSPTRDAVLAAIASTGYRQNTVARALATSSTTTVGLAVSALLNPYFAPLVHAMEERLAAAGYTFVLGDTHDDDAREADVIEDLLDRRVDGLVLAPSARATARTIPRILDQGVPLVLIDRYADADCDQVAPDNAGPVTQLATHLAELGHTRVATVTGLDGLHSTIERREAARRAVLDLGLDDDPGLVVDGASDVATTRAGVRELFTRSSPDRRPTAALVLNNAMTIGTMQGLRDAGLRVPRDVALVCFDDFEWADAFEPRLTAIRQDVDQMGARAIELLLRRIAAPGAPPQRLRVPTTFQHRNSCGCTE